MEIGVACRFAIRFPTAHRGKVGYRRRDLSAKGRLPYEIQDEIHKNNVSEKLK
jgi:hypothetical protein